MEDKLEFPRFDADSTELYVFLNSSKRVRLIQSSKRKRKLAKRGEDVRWYGDLFGWVWIMPLKA